MSFELHNGDSKDVLRTFPSECIDLTVTSPPYDNLRKYNGYTFDFEPIADQLYRVTKPGGVVVWVVGDATINGSETLTSFRQALYFKEIGFNVHDTMVWQKQAPPIVPSVRRYQPNFEYMFVLVKGRLNTFNPIRIKKTSSDRRGLTAHRKANGKAVVRDSVIRTLDKIRENVWNISVGGGQSSTDAIAFQHPAIFPEKLAQDHILSWSKEGDTVLDPFTGSGTTGKMAILNNRKFIGIEISSEYCEIAKRRIEEAAHKEPLFA